MSEKGSKHRRDRRNAILETASKLFAKNGFSGTSIRSIASTANVTISLLYYYFDSKEILWHEALVHGFKKEQMMEKFHTIMSSDLSIEKVREMAIGSGSYFDLLLRNPEHIKMIAWIYAEQHKHAECPDNIEGKVEFFINGIKKLQDSGIVRSDVKARFILTMYAAFCEFWFLSKKRFDFFNNADDKSPEIDMDYIDSAWKILLEGCLVPGWDKDR